MNRTTASLPESVDELCFVRLGIQIRAWSAWPYAVRLGRKIERSATAAIASGAGLLGSEQFSMGWNHFGVLQYWRSFEALEAWSHSAPHSDWWREAVERMRTRSDFGIYHEAFLVARGHVESIYMNCNRVGLATFGTLGEPTGPATTGRGRLGRGRSGQ